jgi:hypothetical protein
MKELDKAFGKALGKFFAFLVGGLIVFWVSAYAAAKLGAGPPVPAVVSMAAVFVYTYLSPRVLPV